MVGRGSATGSLPARPKGLVEQPGQGVDGLLLAVLGPRDQGGDDDVHLVLRDLRETEPEALTGREVGEPRFGFALFLSLATPDVDFARLPESRSGGWHLSAGAALHALHDVDGLRLKPSDRSDDAPRRSRRCCATVYVLGQPNDLPLQWQAVAAQALC